MKIQDSYFVKFANGTSAWLAVGKPVPSGAELVETRPVIMPDFGMVLKHKETGDISTGHWLRRDDSVDKWEEIQEQSDERMD